MSMPSLERICDEVASVIAVVEYGGWDDVTGETVMQLLDQVLMVMESGQTVFVDEIREIRAMTARFNSTAD